MSIIMAAHNAEAFLRRAVRSVVDQSRADWELLVVVNGCTDGTEGIARELAAGERRVRVLESEIGVSRARNAGLAQARGRYVMLLDADDVLMPSALATMVDRAERSGEELGGAFGDFVLTDDRTGAPLLLQRGRFEVVGYEQVMNSVFFAVHAVLTPRMVAERVVFDEGLKVLEDTDWFLRLAEAGARWHRSGEVVADYRIRASSRSAAFEAMATATENVYRRHYELAAAMADQAGRAALAERLAVLLDKAALSYLARMAMRGMDLGDERAVAEAQQRLGAKRGPAVEGAVLGHLSASAMAMGPVLRPMLEGKPGKLLGRWWDLCEASGHLDAPGRVSAMEAIRARNAQLESYLRVT